MDAASAPEWLPSLAMGVGTAVAAFVAYRKGADKEQPAGNVTTQIVAATFTERAQLDRLIGALATVNESLGDSTEIMRELVGLLQAEAQRRHDEAVIREALRLRGITE